MNIKTFNDYLSDSIKGLFLFLLIISSPFYIEYLGHNFKNIFKLGHFIPNIVIFLFIYFVIDISLIDSSKNGDNKPIHPINLLKLTLFIYIFIIIFTRCEIKCTIIISILLTLSFFNYTFYRYYKQINELEIFRKLKVIQNILYFFIVLFLIIGFSIYFKLNFLDKKNKNKSLLNFFFSFPNKII